MENLECPHRDRTLAKGMAVRGACGKDVKTIRPRPGGKAATADMRKQFLNAMIRGKIPVTEAAKEKITVPPQEIADKIRAVKNSINLSDKAWLGELNKRAKVEILAK